MRSEAERNARWRELRIKRLTVKARGAAFIALFGLTVPFHLSHHFRRMLGQMAREHGERIVALRRELDAELLLQREEIIKLNAEIARRERQMGLMGEPF